MTETLEERRRRIYSSAYRNGQRLSSYPDALEKSERNLREADLYILSIGAADYAEGFSDGWHGRVPAIETPLRWDGWR